MKTKYCVKTIRDGKVSYLRDGDEKCWEKEIAEKYAREFVMRFGGSAELEEAESYEY